jgi:hypothetical protein
VCGPMRSTRTPRKPSGKKVNNSSESRFSDSVLR